MELNPLSLFEAFLAALGDPEGGDELYALHADEAMVRHAEGARSIADTDRGEFARLHRELNLQGRSALPMFGDPVVLEAEANAQDPSVSWFEVTELRAQRKLVAAVGVKRTGGRAGLGWVTLATRVEAWSYQDGLLRSLADYAWMRTSEPARARAFIDASYFRLYWRDSRTFSALPDARFSCQMSAVCCKHDFEITLPPEAQSVIDAMPWERLNPSLVGTRLSRRSDGTLQLKELNESCRFLGAQGQCLIHQTLGRQPFGPCCVFPIAFAETPEGMAVGLSPICDAGRLGIGIPLSDRADDLRERLVHARPRKTDVFRLTRQQPITWEQFRDIEKALRAILEAQELPLRRRLHVGARLLAAVRDNSPLDVQTWTGEPMLAITSELRQAIHGMLTKLLRSRRHALASLPPVIPSNLSEAEVRDAAGVAQILCTSLWTKTYSYPYDLTTAFNFSIVLYLLALIMQEAGGGQVSGLMWRELGALAVHGLLAAFLLEGVPEGFLEVFGSAEYGSWMLSA